MKKFLLSFTTLFMSAVTFAQCPDLLLAMVNSCSATSTEGDNEFVVFTTSVTANVSTYKLNYGNSGMPSLNDLSGADATVKTGPGSLFTTGGCSVIQVTSPATSIPAGSRVLFIPATVDQNYDVTGLCNGSNPVYVVYINPAGTNSNWSSNGTMSNSATTPRYLQITYSGSAACNSTNAPVKSFTASGNWPVLTGTAADGNAVSWNGNVAKYFNNGCTAIILPVTLVNFSVSFIKNSNIINWQTSQEINSANFIIEKSYDAKNFKTLATKAAAGFSNSIQSYSFTDDAIEYRPTYYRLKTIDHDGNFKLSKIIKVKPSKGNFSINNIYPNPVKDQLFIEWNSAVKNNTTIVIMDVSGRIIQSTKMATAAGFNQRSIDVANLPPGKYIVKMIGDINCSTTSFLK